MAGYTATPAIVSNLKNKPGFTMGLAAALCNTFCNWEIVEIVGKGSKAGWQGAVIKVLLIHAV